MIRSVAVKIKRQRAECLSHAGNPSQKISCSQLFSHPTEHLPRRSDLKPAFIAASGYAIKWARLSVTRVSTLAFIAANTMDASAGWAINSRFAFTSAGDGSCTIYAFDASIALRRPANKWGAFRVIARSFSSFSHLLLIYRQRQVDRIEPQLIRAQVYNPILDAQFAIQILGNAAHKGIVALVDGR